VLQVQATPSCHQRHHHVSFGTAAEVWLLHLQQHRCLTASGLPTLVRLLLVLQLLMCLPHLQGLPGL
jgi:hypothetical protein